LLGPFGGVLLAAYMIRSLKVKKIVLFKRFWPTPTR
jgi:hypothetical protein